MESHALRPPHVRPFGREAATYQFSAIAATAFVATLAIVATYLRFSWHLRDDGTFPWDEMAATLLLVAGGTVSEGAGRGRTCGRGTSCCVGDRGGVVTDWACSGCASAADSWLLGGAYALLVKPQQNQEKRARGRLASPHWFCRVFVVVVLPRPLVPHARPRCRAACSSGWRCTPASRTRCCGTTSSPAGRCTSRTTSPAPGPLR